MTPSELLDDHQRRPRNIGKLLNASAVGDIGSIVAGDALRFYIKVEGEPGSERLSAVKFQVFNCQDQIGPTSALTELLAGRTLAEAEEIAAPDLCAHLGGLPHLALPPRLWGLLGLAAAIGVWRGTDLPGDVQMELPQLCRCLGIPEETVRQAIAVRGLTEVDQVVAATGAGSVCGSCRSEITLLLGQAVRASAPGAGVASSPLNRIQLMLAITRCAEEQVLPALRQQGGDLELWDLQGQRLLVRPRGRLVDDAAARAQAIATLESVLRSVVDPSLAISE